MSRNKNINMMEGPLAGKVLLYALPLAATGILQQLFNAADVAVVGSFVGKEAMAAVGSNSAIIGLLVNLFIGISLGSNVIMDATDEEALPDSALKEWFIPMIMEKSPSWPGNILKGFDNGRRYFRQNRTGDRSRSGHR